MERNWLSVVLLKILDTYSFYFLANIKKTAVTRIVQQSSEVHTIL